MSEVVASQTTSEAGSYPGLNKTEATFSEYRNSNVDDVEYSPMLWAAEQINDILSIYYVPLLVFTGSGGNILSIVVFFKTKLKKLSSSYYLAALALSDTCFLIGLFFQWLNIFGVTLYNRNFFCQFFTFSSNLCSFLSVWFVVAFTVERFIAVVHPLKRQSMCTVKRAKMVLSGLVLLGCIHCTPFVFFASPTYIAGINATICDVRPEYKFHMTIMNYVDTAVVFGIPFATIVLLNTITGCTVWKFASVRRTLIVHKRNSDITRQSASSPSTGHLGKMVSLSSHSLHPNGTNNINRNSVKSSRKKYNSSQIKVTKMLLIVSTVFVCLNLPSYVMRVRAFLEGEASKTTVIVQYICWFLFLTNFGINFVLYCVSGQNFRKALISMFRKVSTSTQRDKTTQVTVNGVSECIRGSGTGASKKRNLAQNGSWNDVYELRQINSFK